VHAWTLLHLFVQNSSGQSQQAIRPRHIAQAAAATLPPPDAVDLAQQGTWAMLAISVGAVVSTRVSYTCVSAPPARAGAAVFGSGTLAAPRRCPPGSAGARRGLRLRKRIGPGPLSCLAATFEAPDRFR
jgi:hypothetical protein